MASSYVQVRDSENERMLQFDVKSCRSNGQTSNIDEPPKDHTYNKHPEVLEVDVSVITSEEKVVDEIGVFENQASEKPNKNVKSGHITGKVQTGRKAATVVKREASRRIAIRKQLKRNGEQGEITGQEKVSADENNTNTEEPVHVSEEPKKRGRKRKATDNSDEVETKQNEEVIELTVKDEPEESIIENEIVPVLEESKVNQAATEDELNKKKLSPSNSKQAEVKTKPGGKIGNKIKIPKREAPKPSKPVKAVETKTKNVGEPDTSLPPGWTRKLVVRKSGKSAGMIDIYIYSPDGIKFRSRPDIAAYLARVKSSLKVEDFSFTKRGLTVNAVKPPEEKQKPANKSKQSLALKSSNKPKKPLLGGSNSAGKRGQKLLVKLNVSTPRKKAVLTSKAGRKSNKPQRGSQKRK